MLTFRLIYVDADRNRTTVVLKLPGAPYIGTTIDLPDGTQATVHNISSGAPYGLDGVIVAGPVQA